MELVRNKIEIQSRGVSVGKGLLSEMIKLFNVPWAGGTCLLFEISAGHSSKTSLACFTFITDRTPFKVKRDAEEWFIEKGGRRYVTLRFSPRPEFYGLTTGRGRAVREFITLGEYGSVRCSVSNRCRYIEAGKGCGFCAHQAWWNEGDGDTVDEIAREMPGILNEVGPDRIFLNSGTANSRDKGILLLSEAAGKIKNNTSVPVIAGFEAVRDTGFLETLKAGGVDAVYINLEAFDPGLRKSVMPNAKGQIPLSQYARNWHWCAELFGHGNVYTTAIAGLGESDESLFDFARAALDAGAFPVLLPFTPIVGARSAGFHPPSPARMEHLYIGISRIYSRYGMEPFFNDVLGRSGDAFGALKEVHEYLS